MPDLSEVENTLVTLVAQAFYPNGTAAESAIGDPVKVFRGWPVQALLDADLKAEIVNVSIFPMDAEQNVTRFLDEWAELLTPQITTTISVDGQTVIIGGQICCPLNAAVIVNGKGFVYPLQAIDTPTSVATALAALISSTFAATSNGPVLTVPGATKLEARLGTIGNTAREIKRQKKTFRITLWCSTPRARDEAAGVLDPVLAALTNITFSDGSTGRIRYERTRTLDNAQKSLLYRRDFDYSVEYPTTITRRLATILVEQADITTN